MSDYAGIDYGSGRSNVDKRTGMRYGVINQNEVLQAWADRSEPHYGAMVCSMCGDDITIEMSECPNCGADLESEFDFIEPVSYFIDDNEYSAECGEDGDIFITKSPYYTYAQFCSPCAPGAGYLMNFYTPIDEEMRSYEEAAESAGFPRVLCFGGEWFESGKAPYPVFDVKTNRRV